MVPMRSGYVSTVIGSSGAWSSRVSYSACSLRIASAPPAQSILFGPIAAVTHRVRLLVNGDEPAGLASLSRGRVVVGPPPGESWAEVAMPADRDAWTAMVQEHEKAGATGVLVPWDPRLLDLLRNPEPDDRTDL